MILVEESLMNKPRRVRIYKLSTFDTFTDEERVLNETYKNASPKEKALLKKIRDEKIASYKEIRKVSRKSCIHICMIKIKISLKDQNQKIQTIR